MMRIVKDLWRGDISLAITFWALFIVGNEAFDLFGLVLRNSSYLDDTPSVVRTFIYTITVLGIIYLPFSLVCVWRSAGKYEGIKVWSYSARALTILMLSYAILTQIGVM